MKMIQTLFRVALFLVGSGFLYLVFIKYTGSEDFVKKDADAMNMTYSYTNEQFKAVCDQMSPFSYVTGLTEAASILAPVPGRTYYYKSYCYQELAVKTLNDSLCSQVRERRFFYSDGSSVSGPTCRQYVAINKVNVQKREEEAKKFNNSVAGAFQIINEETMTEKVGDDSWKISIVVKGSLKGSYEFQIIQGDAQTQLLKEQVSINKERESFQWIITKAQLAQFPRRLHPIAVTLTLLRSDDGVIFNQPYLTSVGNVTLDMES